MASYNVEVSRSAQKEIRKLPAKTRTQVVSKISGLRTNPRPKGSQKLRGSKSSYRIRQSDYRILYTITNATLIILVIKVAHRREVYR